MNDIELIKKYIKIDQQEDAIKKLEDGYPVQYIIGNVDFYNSNILVNENVLIPRFETEYLIEKTLKYLNKCNINVDNVLEIGTGSGCISIALQKELQTCIDAIDISSDAIEVAKLNANNNNVNINFKVCDIHHFKTDKLYDLIISNPPYVPVGGKIDEKIKYEPQNAIYAPDNGLYFYELILNKINNNIQENYLIAFEIGDNEGVEILKIAKKYLPNSHAFYEKDLNNYDRYLFISNKKLND